MQFIKTTEPAYHYTIQSWIVVGKNHAAFLVHSKVSYIHAYWKAQSSVIEYSEYNSGVNLSADNRAN